MRKPLVGSLTAIVFAVVLLLCTGWHPLCALYTTSNPEYYALLCFLESPKPNSEG